MEEGWIRLNYNSMSQVIKVYDTKANAIANGTTGRIDPVEAITGHAGGISNSDGDSSPYNLYNSYGFKLYL